MEKPIAIQGQLMGNTTRLADYYIQELFKGEPVCFIDHNPTKQNNGLLHGMIARRLWDEHYFKLKEVTKNHFILEAPPWR